MYKTCYSSSFFSPKNEEEAIPPGGKKYLGTTKTWRVNESPREARENFLED